MTVVALKCHGTSLLNETVFENRFMHVSELCRLGGHIRVENNVALVEGGHPLCGGVVRSTDLRAGAAMVIAGLAAKGVTEVEQVQNIERGYETLVEKFVALGADMYRSEIPDSMGMAERA